MVKVPWQIGLEKDPKGQLLFAGRPVAPALRPKAVTAPAGYYLSCQVALSRAVAFRQLLTQKLSQKLHFHYAMKANHHPQLLSTFAQNGFGVDVVSGGELGLALNSGFLSENLVFSGVAKSKAELYLALQKQVCQINVESFAELKRIQSIAQELKTKARVAIRFNPEVKAETHPYIATGFRENKFGVDILDLPEMVDFLKAHNNEFDYQGLSLHIGSQLTDFLALEEAIDKSKQAENLFIQKGLKSKSLDVGGGLGISYRGSESEDFENLNQYAKTLAKVLAGYQKEIRFEPGRFFVARAGFLWAEVEYVKKTPYKNFLIINTGMNALMRPMLYQAYHRIETIPTRTADVAELFDVVGPVCESSDTLGHLRLLQSPQEGDGVLIADAGAYGAVLSNDYNLVGEIKEHIWEDVP